MLGSLVVGLFVCLPMLSYALSGTNADDVEVKIYAKLGGDWFKVSTKHADNKGVVEIKNVIPGWYKIVIDDDDEESGQDLAVRIRMRDRDGKRIKEKTEVEAYMDIDDVKTAIGVYETDKRGWLKVSGLTSESKYYLDIDEKDGSSVSEKDGRYRIKVKAKIDESDWFRALYKRTDENKLLEIKNVLPGKYKFSYKKSDASETDPFTLKIRMIDEDGKKIKEETDINLYAYVNKVKTLIGTLTTDAKGWLTIPGTMTKMKYKLSID